MICRIYRNPDLPSLDPESGLLQRKVCQIITLENSSDLPGWTIPPPILVARPASLLEKQQRLREIRQQRDLLVQQLKSTQTKIVPCPLETLAPVSCPIKTLTTLPVLPLSTNPYSNSLLDEPKMTPEEIQRKLTIQTNKNTKANQGYRYSKIIKKVIYKNGSAPPSFMEVLEDKMLNRTGDRSFVSDYPFESYGGNVRWDPNIGFEPTNTVMKPINLSTQPQKGCLKVNGPVSCNTPQVVAGTVQVVVTKVVYQSKRINAQGK